MREPRFSPRDLNEGFVVAITITAKTGEGDAVAEILEGLIEPTLAEPSVKLFLPYRSATDPRCFFIYELYRNEAAWTAHQETEHFKKALPDLRQLAAKRERVPFVPFLSL